MTSPGLKSNKTIDLIYQLVNILGWLKEISEHLNTQEMYNEAVQMEPCSVAFVPDHFKTQEMCNKAVCMEPLLLKYVLDHLTVFLFIFYYLLYL